MTKIDGAEGIMGEKLWEPDQQRIGQANVTAYMGWLEENNIFSSHQNWHELYEWSINYPDKFWESLWDYCKVLGDKGAPPFQVQEGDFYQRRFFPKARVNYAENMLRSEYSGPAIIFHAEDQKEIRLSYKELREQVSRLRIYLREKCGIEKGDRVAGYLHSGPESVIGFLATVSLGAIWSSCSPDFGVSGVLDRFKQIEPKVMIITDGYFFKGKSINVHEKNKEILRKLSTVQKVVQCSLIGAEDLSGLGLKQDIHRFEDIVSDKSLQGDLAFERVSFDHPLVILFSSGTTGTPKCIVHGHGGCLLQHLKEHRFHSDIKSGDRVFYYTTTGWMMWNWLVGALGSGATIVMYDGSPFHPRPEALFDHIDREKISFFGVSAKYIDALAKEGARPRDSHDLSSLRAIGSTGSPLVPESFEYVYKSIKKDVNLASLSGGTDIVSCFALGSPVLPVYAGELQTRGLGMSAKVFNDQGREVTSEKGELVCDKPFPCMPVKFWNDSGNQKFKKAYFSKHKGIWTHGDFCTLQPTGGLIIHGRSDSVLNPGGVRIGTAEIYRQVEKFNEIDESIAVGQSWDGDTRIILFVKLRSGKGLTPDLIQKIKDRLRTHASPRHVPAKILEVKDVPKTRSGKIVEVAVTDIIHGQEVKNTSMLSNPEALDHFKNRPELND